jgi:D-glycero-D-manno-heptose 1,7-bisphosphate phosphatase
MGPWFITLVVDSDRLMKRAVFLDRDGVINRKAAEDGYVRRWDDFHFLPGVAWTIFHPVISNQQCVAKGLLTIGELEAIHQKMLEEPCQVGCQTRRDQLLPHDKEPPCPCRKPSHVMLVTAAQKHQIDLHRPGLLV